MSKLKKKVKKKLPFIHGLSTSADKALGSSPKDMGFIDCRQQFCRSFQVDSRADFPLPNILTSILSKSDVYSATKLNT